MQTGTGKTHTMDGGHGDTERGIIPKAFAHIFDAIQVSLVYAGSVPSRQQSASHGLHGASWLASGICSSDSLCPPSMNHGSTCIALQLHLPFCDCLRHV